MSTLTKTALVLTLLGALSAIASVFYGRQDTQEIKFMIWGGASWVVMLGSWIVYEVSQ